jgi:hypothetical protein
MQGCLDIEIRFADFTVEEIMNKVCKLMDEHKEHAKEAKCLKCLEGASS